jgi:hypothetical protein
MLQRIGMDVRVGLVDQLAQEVGPLILVITFRVAPEDIDELLQAWAADAALMKSKPGFSSTQLHVSGSRTRLQALTCGSGCAFVLVD